jgi:hypothetical protein
MRLTFMIDRFFYISKLLFQFIRTGISGPGSEIGDIGFGLLEDELKIILRSW